MANEKFFLIFPDKPQLRVEIDEPIDFSDVDFNLDQKEGGMARDASLSGGLVKFRFTIERNHKLEDLLYLNHINGYESDVKIVIVLENKQEFIGELDFATSETNDFDYFECSAILESELQIFKRRAKTKVDLFSSKTVDGAFIEPLSTVNMFLQSKPSIQVSEWQNLSEMDTSIGQHYNPCVSLTKSDIEDSFTFFSANAKDENIYDDGVNINEHYQMIKAKTNLKNITIFFKDLDMKATRIISGLPTELSLFAYYNNTRYLLKKVKSNTPDKIFQGDFTYEIPFLNRENSLSIYFFRSGSEISNIKSINISVESTSYNSITPTFRLIDVMKQIVKSTSGLSLNAPRYDAGGQFYENVLTNGKLLGGVTNQPFYVSWEDIEKSIYSEHNADSEITTDGRVFVGIEEDFYTGYECGFFDNTQFSGLVKKANPIYCLNEFKFKYAKYQSLKENTEPNSESTIHGESILTPFNKKVENSKECSIQWNRDAILLDVQQRLSTKVSKDTATQDDDTLFAIDTITTLNDQTFTESTTLSHSYTTAYLLLRNNGEVNFLVLGIKEGTVFTIEYPDANSGIYTVQLVSNTELQLVKTSEGVITALNDGIRLTKYIYTIEKETIPLTNRTNQGFSVVLNLINPEKYSNLRYSVERNIRNYWNSFLATINLWHKEKPIKNTFYKNNGKCETEYLGLRVIEKEDFIPTNPIVTPFMYEDVVFANVDFSDFIDLQTQIRTKRGYIRTIDNNKRVLKLYPIKMSYENKSRQLTISGQEKFEKSYLTITNQGSVILINNETRLRELTYEIEEGNKIVLFDLERQRLYNGVYWDKVSVNGANAETIEILIGWLDLL